MLNHARCLLMNVDGRKAILGYPGDELLDAAYRPLMPPDAVFAVRRLLYGATPDRSMLNYRVRQCLALLHASPLAEYLTALDPRITYLPFQDDLTRAYAPQTTFAYGTAAANLRLIGVPRPDDAGGRMQYAYDIQVDAGSVTVTDLADPRLPISTVLTVVNGASQLVPLGSSGMSIILADIGDQGWSVTAYARPVRDLAALTAALGSIGEPVLIGLFGVQPQEPYLTFQNLWQEKEEIGPKLGGLLCALLGRMEERRLGVS